MKPYGTRVCPVLKRVRAEPCYRGVVRRGPPACTPVLLTTVTTLYMTSPGLVYFMGFWTLWPSSPRIESTLAVGVGGWGWGARQEQQGKGILWKVTARLLSLPKPSHFSEPLFGRGFLRDRERRRTMAHVQRRSSGPCQTENFQSPGTLGCVEGSFFFVVGFLCPFLF